MADALMVDEGLWEVFEPLLAEHSPRQNRRARVGDRAAFTAVVFVLLTGAPWRMVPRELGCSGQTASRRLRDWRASGVWERLQRELLRRVGPPGRIDWSAALTAGASARPGRNAESPPNSGERRPATLSAALA